jgi:hypothetical protein
VRTFTEDQSDDENDGDLVTDVGDDDDDDDYDEEDHEYLDHLEPVPDNIPSNYAEPPELPPFSKKNKKKPKRSRWERYQVRVKRNVSVHTRHPPPPNVCLFNDLLCLLSCAVQNQPLHNYMPKIESMRASGSRSTNRSQFLG